MASGTKVEKKEASGRPVLYRLGEFPSWRIPVSADSLRAKAPASTNAKAEASRALYTRRGPGNSEIAVKVLVTGGTGFVGSHAVAALVRGGHEVRLLVRDPRKIHRALGARGIQIDDYVVGDMVDAEITRKALMGCDAVLHAAATLYGGRETLASNLQGARNVLGIGCELGLDPILFTSTVGAMFPPAGECFTVDDPIRGLTTTYGRSKTESERFARELQARGAPIVCIYPAGVFGPDDPGPGESTKGLRDAIRFGWPIVAGGMSIVDVRDLAEIIAAALEAGRGPRRYMAGGHFAGWSELADLCDSLTGRRARRVPMPAALLRGLGRLLDAAKQIVPFEYPITHEAAQMMTRFAPCDSRATVEQLGIPFRPTLETLADTIRCLYEAGEISSHAAGRMASQRSR
jgi:dihydroflavonol-4-reductase